MIEKILNPIIDHLKRSPVLQTAVASADNLMDQINNAFKHEPISLDMLVEKLSPSTDNLIIATESEEGIKFIGGELTAYLPPADLNRFALNLKLYYKNSSDEFVLKEREKMLDRGILTTDSLAELKEKEQSFEVNEPAT